ncbi:MAG TPA: hypothetical protein VHU88_01180 [Sporichthyaceae bacterium]|nr:hypothetical protein [Sporichthyaceae bacterium]
MSNLRGPVAARVARWSTVGATGLGVGYLLGDKDVGLAIVLAGYLFSWRGWPDRRPRG